jgi:hypothetical protein
MTTITRTVHQAEIAAVLLVRAARDPGSHGEVIPGAETLLMHDHVTVRFDNLLSD